ncbi:ATP-binding protein [Corallococcus exercitus]|uniref:ATP-binding protein n=1 Tax=Corallococcus exercitus TaxID=2316736 RepID=UPI0035D4282F
MRRREPHRVPHRASGHCRSPAGRGSLSHAARNADLLFQVVSIRYAQRSLVLTSKLAFWEWTGSSPNGACATALIHI